LDVAPLLAGEIGVALVPGPPGDARDADGGAGAAPGMPPHQVVHVVVELRDPAQGQALLARVMSGEAWAERAQPAGSGAYRVARPDGAPLHVGIAGRYLWASTGWTPGALPALGTGR